MVQHAQGHLPTANSYLLASVNEVNDNAMFNAIKNLPMLVEEMSGLNVVEVTTKQHLLFLPSNRV